MVDEKIIDLLWQRCEADIELLDRKYGGYCFSIANRIQNDRRDAEECVSDTYLAAWNQIPPTGPGCLSAFLGRITRNLSISRWRSRSARVRGGGEMEVALEELAGCVAGPWDVTRELEQRELERVIRAFCGSLSAQDRVIFLKRYYFLSTIPEIARETGFSQAKVKSSLHRTRNKLKKKLEKEALYERR